jgi:hypothetical protein
VVLQSNRDPEILVQIQRYWFRVLPLRVGHLIKTRNYKKPGVSPSRDFLGIEYMKQGKYISGDERGGFKVVKVNLPYWMQD